jgi:Mn2+/Fe2+ NRAMP family transporter
MGDHTNGPLFNTITWITTIVMIGFTLLLLIRTI